MFHSNTELLIDYWRARRGEARLPPRAGIDPADFAALLPQTFIASREAPGVYPLRLAGERIIDLHGRSLRGENVVNLWTRAHRIELQTALEGALREPSPLVVSAEGRNDEGEALRLEVLFAPIAGASGKADRFLGLYQPTSTLRLQRRPIRELMIRAVGGADIAPPRLRLAALDGRRIA
ncbi:MAG TPA: PAS domain-containing protein [Caulobacteraceae bacterium]|nr:PAS domain-containing protein [Caulobacteraceae bacterium]